MVLGGVSQHHRTKLVVIAGNLNVVCYREDIHGIPVLQENMHTKSSMAGGIVMLEGHVRMSLQEGYHMREEDVFPVTHSVEIACNDNKLSPMMV